MKTNKEYKEIALSKLRGNWKPGVIASAVMLVLTLIFSGLNMLAGESTILSLLFTLLQVVVLMPFSVGMMNAFRLMLSNDDYNILNNSVDLAKANWKRYTLGELIMGIKIMLWTFLLIIPGLIKGYAYMLTPYILKDNPEVSAKDASSLSDEMMKGHKFDLFYLHLSFIGWAILSILTCGIGALWLSPYMYSAQAAFYEDVKAEYASRKQTAA